MKPINRREFSHQFLGAISGFALMESLFYTNAFAKTVRPITDHWAIRLNEFCRDLQLKSITLPQWQSQVEELYREIALEELLEFIDFKKLIKGFQYPDLGVNARMVHFPTLTGLPDKTVYYKKIIGMKKDRAIIPHGHSHMASAHLIINGEFQLRHYEKIRQEGQHLIIKPSIDKVAKLGDCSSISDEKDNVHWFVANTVTAFTFDVIMLDLNNQKYDIHNLDIYEQQKVGDGQFKGRMHI
ncbi:MAG: hypothetical protein AAFU64_17250 [Bacteroidota bacterium]